MVEICLEKCSLSTMNNDLHLGIFVASISLEMNERWLDKLSWNDFYGKCERIEYLH